MAAGPLLILIGLHVASGLVAVMCGAGAMLARKGSSRHRRFGRAYVIVLVLLCGSATALASLDWAHRRVWRTRSTAQACASVQTGLGRQHRQLGLPEPVAVAEHGPGWRAPPKAAVSGRWCGGGLESSLAVFASACARVQPAMAQLIASQGFGGRLGGLQLRLRKQW